MKKFTRILVCLMLCVFGFGLMACDRRTKEEKNFTYPHKNDVVYGNGGLAVKKGNYVYFVNGYKSVSSISSKKATYTVGSLMLMKLGENGEVVTNDQGLLNDDYYITMNNKLCGYEATNLYIHGEYLYFVSPSLENESGDKVWAKDRVVFNRIKLDKTSKVEEVYASGVKYDQLKYEYYEENGKLCILAWEKGDSYYADNGNNALIRINATNKSSEKIADGVSSVAFAENSNEIFFVKNGDGNYTLKQYDIIANEQRDYTSFANTFEVKFVAGGQVFITMSHPYGSTTDLKVSNIASRNEFDLVYAYSDSLTLSAANDGTVFAVSSNVISIIKDADNIKIIKDEEASSINLIDFTNGCILYYDDVSNLKLVSYSNVLAGDEPSIQTLTSIDAVSEDYAYFDLNEGENMLYFLKLSGDDYYLHRIKVNNNLGETEEMFGVYEEFDVPSQEETEDAEEEVE